MELFFQEVVIGYIDSISKEGFWNYGIFTPNEDFKNYIDFFKAIVCECGFDETEFDNELMKDDNWYIRDNGNKIGISIPAIYEDGDISFRYR